MADNPYAALYQSKLKDSGISAYTPANGQGSSPNYSPDTTVENPTGKQMFQGLGREGAQLLSGGYGFGRKALELVPGVKGSRFGNAMDEHQQFLDEAAKPQNTGEAMGKTGAELASYLAPGAAEERVTMAAPEAIRPLARIATGALSSGTMGAANGHPFGTSALAGGATGALAEGGRMVAPQLMRSGIGGGINSDTARAVLNETRAVRPATLEGQVGGRISAANADLDKAVNGSQSPISMQPMRTPIETAMKTARTQEAGGLHNELSDMLDFTHKGRVSGDPIPNDVSPRQALDLRRGFNEEYLGNRAWKQTVNPRSTATGKQAYQGLSSELHNKVPGASEADEQMHRLIPAKQALSAMNRREPSIVGNMAGDITARTGAMAGPLTAAVAGAHSAGAPGALAGFAAGLAGKEALSMPFAKIAASRMLYSPTTGRLMRAGVVPFINSLKQANTGGQEQ